MDIDVMHDAVPVQILKRNVTLNGTSLNNCAKNNIVSDLSLNMDNSSLNSDDIVKKEQRVTQDQIVSQFELEEKKIGTPFLLDGGQSTQGD